jgi:hypothetical protein
MPQYTPTQPTNRKKERKGEREKKGRREKGRKEGRKRKLVLRVVVTSVST